MESDSLELLHKVQLDMLVKFDRICAEHGLAYFLDSGTALGAVRHGGFIPWDDDVDVAMPRADYEKLLEIGARGLPDQLYLQTYETDPAYMMPFAKIRLGNTFFPEPGNKMITTSGGGALICAEPEMKQKALWYATQAREPYPYYQHEAVGFNYRLSNICAGIGRGQMKVVNDHIAHHRHVQALYEELLAGVSGVTLHGNPEMSGQASRRFDSNFWLCTMTLDPAIRIKGQERAYEGMPRTDCEPNANVETLRTILDQAGIEVRPLWKPMHKQPVYKDAPSYVNGVSESLFNVGLCLPAGPYVSDDDVKYIAETIKNAIVS